MKEYLKMADVFVGEYKPKRRIDAWPPSKHGETLVDISGKPAEYAVHAINSHDELVAEVERLRYENSILRTKLENSERLIKDRISKSNLHNLIKDSGLKNE